MKEKIRKKILLAPEEPGVFIFKNKGVPIYIGKAKRLSNRLRSYLNPQTEKVFRIGEEADELETIVVMNEREAFILEANLIKKYRPKYNVRLKDTDF
uniref:UvrABC system protein C n=1 Tax=Thermotoga maritima TaxID=2336 RepID=UPI00004E1818|nr:Chain A, UvrABC system protein C [Thermotoga maritima]